MPGKHNTIASRIEYYRTYYLQYEDRYKNLYYDRKIKQLERIQLYQDYGGERNYYEEQYKKFLNNIEEK